MINRFGFKDNIYIYIYNVWIQSLWIDLRKKKDNKFKQFPKFYELFFFFFFF